MMAERSAPLAAENPEAGPPEPERQQSPAESAAEGRGAGAHSAGEVDFTALVIAHHAALYRYAYRLCGCATEAEDLTQQAFLVAQQKLYQLREAERASAWLYAVLRSCFLKSIRKQRPANAQGGFFEVEDVADETPEVDEIDRELLAAALASLPEDFRLVVLMFYFEDLSYQEIAEQLEIPIGTVMSRLSRAKGHLRKRLAGESAASSGELLPTEPSTRKPAGRPALAGKQSIAERAGK